MLQKNERNGNKVNNDRCGILSNGIPEPRWFETVDIAEVF